MQQLIHFFVLVLVRDLAARNVLLSDTLEPAVSDFGCVSEEEKRGTIRRDGEARRRNFV